MAFRDRLLEMTAAICRGDGAGAAACFTPDGVYHDVFYGEWTGADIATMVTDRFHRDGADFRWDLRDCAETGDTGLARYVFSYRSRLPEAEGRRALFEGVAVCHLRNGLIARYSEVANTVTGLRMMGFSDARLGKWVDRQTDELAGRTEAAGHVG